MAPRKRSRGLIRKRSKRGSKQPVSGLRKPKAKTPPEARAPITTEVERQLRALSESVGRSKFMMRYCRC